MPVFAKLRRIDTYYLIQGLNGLALGINLEIGVHNVVTSSGQWWTALPWLATGASSTTLFWNFCWREQSRRMWSTIRTRNLMIRELMQMRAAEIGAVVASELKAGAPIEDVIKPMTRH